MSFYKKKVDWQTWQLYKKVEDDFIEKDKL
jgi:hypothetical protein